MVQAIWDGRKTQTRRIVKPQPTFVNQEAKYAIKEIEGKPFIECNCFCKVGDILWVRETWKKFKKRVGMGNDCRIEEFYGYKADENNPTNPSEFYDGKWHPSIHMPRSASRLFLKVKSVRVGRLQDITEEDAMAEGVKGIPRSRELYPIDDYIFPFKSLWDSIYKSQGYGWDSNCWVWVVEFEKI